MPKATYFNLTEEKRNKIYAVLVEEFANYSINSITVKQIVEKINIPRGSFYQYFESVHECYFYILEKEIKELHSILFQLIRSKHGDVASALSDFGKLAAQELYQEKKYKLYKSRYLFFDTELETKWHNYLAMHDQHGNTFSLDINAEKVYFISSVIHSLIKRLFQEAWDEKTFINNYNKYVKWIKEGVLYDEFN